MIYETIDQLKEDFFAGKVKAYKLEELIWSEIYKGKIEKWAEASRQANLIRLKYLENKLGITLKNIEKHYVCAAAEKRGRRTTGIEMQIGGAAIPLGIAGPLKIIGEYARGDFFLPMATNEAALIAGLNRGCKTINEAGGVKVLVTRDGMTRAPVLETPSISHAFNLVRELSERGELYQALKEAAEAESTVSKLIDIQPFQLGRTVWLRYVFQTGDSMGMNSATKYTANSIKKLRETHPWVKLIALSGNLCVDKKSSHINVIFGRGKSVESEVIIPKRVLAENYGLKNERGEIVAPITPKDVEKVNLIKNYKGSALSGTFSGFNANAANAVAAIFAATGQDLAQVVESSSAFSHADVTEEGDLYFGISMPSLELGTVGGGMDYETAKECLSIMGCAGPGEKPGVNAKKLAEIVVAAVTAQELNLLGTLASEYELGESHIRLARGK